MCAENTRDRRPRRRPSPYDTFADAANTNALKVVLHGADSQASRRRTPAPSSPTEPPGIDPARTYAGPRRVNGRERAAAELGDALNPEPPRAAEARLKLIGTGTGMTT
jgi:hypothetical protein